MLNVEARLRGGSAHDQLSSTLALTPGEHSRRIRHRILQPQLLAGNLQAGNGCCEHEPDRRNHGGELSGHAAAVTR